jgi:ceramide glucosyltransferase
MTLSQVPSSVSLVLLGIAGAGLILLTVQWVLAVRWLRKPRKQATRYLGISILKPLCGIDDDLERNLAHFAQLDYPNYEVILGVKDRKDPAYAVAQKAVRRWPRRMRLVLQRGEPGLNPKVNQLIGLEAVARHDVILVSDSNVRTPPGYLNELAAQFEDPDVACASNPIVGIGEQRLGSLLDALHLGASVAPGVIASKASIDHDIVIGKSMAMRRDALAALGGFQAAKDHLAEDYVLGGQVANRLGKKVAICQLPVYNVSKNRSVREFLDRYIRWSIIHRTAIAPSTYFGQMVMNPLPWALLALAVHPSRWMLGALLLAWSWKCAMDLSATRLFRGEPLPAKVVWANALKDVLIAVAWLNGLFRRTVVWRGTRLRVEHGSKLVPLGPSLAMRVLALRGRRARRAGTGKMQPLPGPTPTWDAEESASDRSVA